MTATSETIARPTAHELVITRVFEAPRVLVWQAWTQSEHLLRWSCPRDFAMLFSEGDLRVGGNWRAGMRSPEGREYVMGGEYREIAEPERLVFTHGWEDDEIHDGHETLVTVLLEESSGRTTMTFSQANLATASSRDGHAEGWRGAFDNLEAYLREAQNATQ
jgi:uncharacterized protein YndB with AHSA1/START domain